MYLFFKKVKGGWQKKKKKKRESKARQVGLASRSATRLACYWGPSTELNLYCLFFSLIFFLPLKKITRLTYSLVFTWLLNVITNIYFNFNIIFQLLCMWYENNNINNKSFMKIQFNFLIKKFKFILNIILLYL